MLKIESATETSKMEFAMIAPHNEVCMLVQARS
jgi:hypothetical protein